MDCSLPGSSVHRGSPGKNTREGCHVLLQGMFPTQGSNPGLPNCRWFLFFFPLIFISWRLITLQYCSGFCHTLTWISHGFTCIPHPDPCRWFLYQLSHQGSPRILEWVAYPFSRGSSGPWDQTRASCTAGGFFTSWATREAHTHVHIHFYFS